MHLLDQVRAQAANGTCVLYTTHYMEEAQELCDKLAIIDGGKIIAAGTLSELRDQIGDQNVLRISGQFDVESVRPTLDNLDDAEVVSVDPDCILLATRKPSQLIPTVFARIATTEAIIRETTFSQASLESLFIKLTGKGLRE